MIRYPIIDFEKLSEEEQTNIRKFYREFKKNPDEVVWMLNASGNEFPLRLLDMIFGNNYFNEDEEES